MSYLNGKDVFPPQLLEEIQRYVQGTRVYIPKVQKKARQQSALEERNREICLRYLAGCSVKALAEEFFLSTQAIYKILSGNKK